MSSGIGARQSRAANLQLELTWNHPQNGTLSSTIERAMRSITANDLSPKGVSVLEAASETQDEAIISVRGKPRFVVMDIAHHDRLREADIHSAWAEARLALSQTDFVSANAAEHNHPPPRGSAGRWPVGY